MKTNWKAVMVGAAAVLLTAGSAWAVGRNDTPAPREKAPSASARKAAPEKSSAVQAEAGKKRAEYKAKASSQGQNDATTKASSQEPKNTTASAEARKAQYEAKKAETEAKRAALQEKASQRVDQRQENQTRRIDHGIEKGYLTDSEIETLQAQQKKISDMEEQFKGDGKLTRDEFKSLRHTLGEASLSIWTNKHDTEGGQMPVYRLGKNVRLNSEFEQKLQSPGLTREQARGFMKDFHRATELKRLLATQELTQEQREKLQKEYNTLLNNYFVLAE